jgi:hypothetical protein
MILLCYFKDFIYADLQYPVGVTYWTYDFNICQQWTLHQL